MVKFDDLRSLLIGMLQTQVRRGDVVLSSGRTSSVYIECAPVVMSNAGFHVVGSLIAARMLYHRSEAVAIGGPATGADAIALAVASRVSGMSAFSVREGGIENPPPSGSVVTVVDDVMTTGRSAGRAVRALRDAGYRPDRVIVLVDRGGPLDIDGLAIGAITTLQDITGRPEDMTS